MIAPLMCKMIIGDQDFVKPHFRRSPHFISRALCLFEAADTL